VSVHVPAEAQRRSRSTLPTSARAGPSMSLIAGGSLLRGRPGWPGHIRPCCWPRPARPTAHIVSVLDGDGQPTVLIGHMKAVACVAWSPAGELIATGSHDQIGGICIVSDDSGNALCTEHGLHRSGHGGVLVAGRSPSGRRG